MKSSVITFPGSNCDRDMDVALKKFGFNNKMVWHNDGELPKSDLIVLHTEWNDFRFLNFKKLIKQDNFQIFDMRNIYSPAKMKNQKIDYFSIGRQ